jgi:co-chaperonin GroES (HSP10)
MDWHVLPDVGPLRAAESRILTELLEDDPVRPSGLVIPDTAVRARRGCRARVLPGGVCSKLREVIHEGDVVIIPLFAGAHFRYGDQQVWAVHHHDVLAVVEDEAA